jgi:amidase
MDPNTTTTGSTITPIAHCDMLWQEMCTEKRKRQYESIPTEWRLPQDVIAHPFEGNVMDIPKKTGLLSEKEFQITETTDVGVLLQKLADGTLSSVEVTTAFYKRAVIAQQLVCIIFILYTNVLKSETP